MRIGNGISQRMTGDGGDAAAGRSSGGGGVDEVVKLLFGTRVDVPVFIAYGRRVLAWYRQRGYLFAWVPWDKQDPLDEAWKATLDAMATPIGGDVVRLEAELDGLKSLGGWLCAQEQRNRLLVRKPTDRLLEPRGKSGALPAEDGGDLIARQFSSATVLTKHLYDVIMVISAMQGRLSAMLAQARAGAAAGGGAGGGGGGGGSGGFGESKQLDTVAGGAAAAAAAARVGGGGDEGGPVVTVYMEFVGEFAEAQARLVRCEGAAMAEASDPRGGAQLGAEWDAGAGDLFGASAVGAAAGDEKAGGAGLAQLSAPAEQDDVAAMSVGAAPPPPPPPPPAVTTLGAPAVVASTMAPALGGGGGVILPPPLLSPPGATTSVIGSALPLQASPSGAASDGGGGGGGGGEGGSWACPTCTAVNAVPAPSCGVCGAPVSAAATAATDVRAAVMAVAVEASREGARAPPTLSASRLGPSRYKAELGLTNDNMLVLIAAGAVTTIKNALAARPFTVDITSAPGALREQLVAVAEVATRAHVVDVAAVEAVLASLGLTILRVTAGSWPGAYVLHSALRAAGAAAPVTSAEAADMLDLRHEDVLWLAGDGLLGTVGRDAAAAAVAAAHVTLAREAVHAVRERALLTPILGAAAGLLPAMQACGIEVSLDDIRSAVEGRVTLAGSRVCVSPRDGSSSALTVAVQRVTQQMMQEFGLAADA